MASRYEVSPCICWETRKWPLKSLVNMLGMEEKNNLGIGQITQFLSLYGLLLFLYMNLANHSYQYALAWLF